MITKHRELALYGLMSSIAVASLASPVTLSAEGDAIPFFGLQLPAVVDANKALARRTEEVHEYAGDGRLLPHRSTCDAATLFHHCVRQATRYGESCYRLD